MITSRGIVGGIQTLDAALRPGEQVRSVQLYGVDR
jgi:hypothetical protein